MKLPQGEELNDWLAVHGWFFGKIYLKNEFIFKENVYIKKTYKATLTPPPSQLHPHNSTFTPPPSQFHHHQWLISSTASTWCMEWLQSFALKIHALSCLEAPSWCGVVWCWVVWCGVLWCGVVWWWCSVVVVKLVLIHW